jgi:hypothetical protein
MPREISDDEYNALMGKAQVADFVETIWNDPQLAPEAKRLVKKKYPQVQIPDYDIESRLHQRVDHEVKRFEEYERKKIADEQERKFQNLRNETKTKYGLTDEGMSDLEKFMMEKNIGDYEVAAEYRIAKTPKQSDADYGRDHFWDHSKQKGFSDVSADPEGWARKEILGAIRRDEEKNRQQKF